MPGTMSVDGIISNLNTQEVIDKLVEMRKASVKRLEDKQTALNDKLAVWQEMNTRMLALRLKTDAIANPNTFGAKTVLSDNEQILTATAGSDAVTGTYYMKVKSVAMAHQIQSQGYSDLSSVVGNGDLKITVAGKLTTIKLDDSNNTLVGLKDAINRAGAGVKAAIINTGEAEPYRLVVTSDSTGNANAVNVEIPLPGDGGLQGGESPTFTTLQAASDATIELGSGGILVTKPTNTIDDLLPGVRLTVKSADLNKVVTLNVQQDNESIRAAVDGFIEQYNNIVSYINEQFAYDQKTKATGILFGDFSLMTVQMDVSSIATSPIAGLSQNLKALTSIGIKTTFDGTLKLDEAEFKKVLSESPDQIKGIFAATGSSTDSGVTFIAVGKDTIANSAGYDVSISRTATKNRLTAGVAISGPLTNDETLTINGKTITLEAGWGQDEIKNAINARSKETGVVTSFTDVSGQGSGSNLTLTSSYYGSVGSITVKSSLSNADPLVFTSGLGNLEITPSAAAGESGTGTGTKGVDVAGTINGKPATGTGQTLVSSEGDSKGLRVLIAGGVTGSRGKVSFSRGVGSQLSLYLTSVTDKYGTVGSAQDTLNKKIGDLQTEITDLNQRLQKKEQQLYKQFMDMENALGKLKSQGNAISGMLAGYAK